MVTFVDFQLISKQLFDNILPAIEQKMSASYQEVFFS